MDFRNEKNVFILDHPLIQHKITRLRDKNTGTAEFRKVAEEIAMLMGYEAYVYHRGTGRVGTPAQRASGCADLCRTSGS